MIAMSCKHVFQSSLFNLTSLTPAFDLKPLATGTISGIALLFMLWQPPFLIWVSAWLL